MEPLQQQRGGHCRIDLADAGLKQHYLLSVQHSGIQLSPARLQAADIPQLRQQRGYLFFHGSDNRNTHKMLAPFV
ncbi:hypothetical protein D3C74_480050 [compost metagenome]